MPSNLSKNLNENMHTFSEKKELIYFEFFLLPLKLDLMFILMKMLSQFPKNLNLINMHTAFQMIQNTLF